MLITLSLQALVRANERSFYKEILSYVRVVAFFGTPHQGSEAANWAKNLANMVNVMSFNSAMNTTLAENLQEQSDVLFKISGSFVDWCEELKIVVLRKSALLLRSNETPVPLNADHRSLCRFSTSEEDRGKLELVLSNFKNLVNEVISKDKKKWIRKLQRLVKKRYAIFFFKEGIDNQQSAVHALRAVLHQIFSRDEGLSEYFYLEYQRKGSKVLEEFNTLFATLEKVVANLALNCIVRILDALDECPQNDMVQLLRALMSLYKVDEDDEAEGESPARKRSKSCFKLAIFSRPENVIKNTPKKYERVVRLKGENETSSISHDIALVIQQCVNNLRTEVELPRKMLEDLSQRLDRGADSTFLWATLMIKVLGEHIRCYGGISKNELEILIHGSDIFAIYKHMLGRITPRPNAIKML
ncbi:hypothetical protein F4811DRAFT_557984 [Daldinia bambusicola]|nr:hypothetical protein F4811DRAFT_557984 [Daldinia bambusicola]